MLYGPNSKALTDGNGENNTNYQNPEFDKLFEQMKFLEDGPEKQKLIDRMIEIVQKRRRVELRLLPDVGGGLSPVDQQRQAARRSCATTSATCGSIPSSARARSPNGTSRSGGRSR